MVIVIKKINWDDPYKSNNVTGEGLLVGMKDGNLIYLNTDNVPTKNSIIFCGSKEQKNVFLSSNIYNSIFGGKNIILVSDSLPKEIFEILKDNDYVIKEFDTDENSNHWSLFKLLKEDNPEKEVKQFVDRIIAANKLKPTEHQTNALNYLAAVIMCTRYSQKESIKKVKEYITDYDLFEEDVLKLPTHDTARQMFEFAKQANNYLKWDIPCIPEILRPFFSKKIIKKLDSGGMSISELKEKKCLYLFKPSKVYPWIVPLILSYIYEADLNLDMYIDEIDITIPHYKSLLSHNNKTVIVSSNFKDFDKFDAGILSMFGSKLACHGCDLEAAKYLSELSGVHPGSNKFEGNKKPQEIMSCGQKNIILFLASAKTYNYKLVDVSFLEDVVKSSFEDAKRKE